MVIFQPFRALVVASVVWLGWRLFVWWRRGGDPVREAAIAGLFIWALIVVRYTFFPLIIIFYDWAGSSNLVPFSSIAQLVRETNAQVAFRNIAGNVVLFVPFGLLMPLLFERVGTLRAVLVRAAAVSVAIEIVQTITRARATDVDDVILNVSGAAVGYLLFAVVHWLLDRPGAGRNVLARLRSPTAREPLLLGVVPIAATAVVVVPAMVASLFSATLGGGAGGILGDATAAPGSSVVARADAAAHTFLVVADGAGSVSLRIYERLPLGRYTLTASGGSWPDDSSFYNWSITEFDTEREELPTVVVWGVNDVAASTVVVTVNGVATERPLPEDRYFAVGFAFDIYANPGGALLEIDARFFDERATDLTEAFASPQE